MGTINKVLAKVTKVENVTVAVLFIIMVVTSFMQVLNRNIFRLPLSWLEETSRFAMIFMAFIGTELGLRDGTQIAVTGIVDRLKGRAKLAVSVISKVLVIAISAAVAVGAFQLMQVQMVSGQVSASLHMPMWIPYLVMGITFILMIATQIISVVSMLDGYRTGGDRT